MDSSASGGAPPSPPKARRALAALAPTPFALALLALLGANYLLSRELVDHLPRDWPTGTVRRAQKDFHFHDSGQDSWYPMAMAYERFLAGEGGGLYGAVFFQGGVKFQYPPSALLLYRLMEALDPRPVEGARQGGGFYGRLFGTWIPTLDEAMWRAAWGTILLGAGLLLACRWRSGGALPLARRWLDRALVLGLGIALGSSFYPVLRAYTLGQVQAALTLGFGLAAALWMMGREAPAGVLMGLASLFKPQWGLFLAWGLLRRRWRFSAAMAAAAFAGLGLSVALFGFGNHLDYVKVMGFIAKHGEAYHPNQSLNGLLQRALGNGNNAEWVGDAFPPYHPGVYWPTLAGSLAMMGLALAPPRGWKPARGASRFDFCLAGLAFAMASPVAWEHHYGVLLPIFAILAPAIAERSTVRSAAAWACALAYLLSAHWFEFLVRFAGTPWTPLQSHLFFGALIALGLLARERRLAISAEPSPESENPPAEGEASPEERSAA